MVFVTNRTRHPRQLPHPQALLPSETSRGFGIAACHHPLSFAPALRHFVRRASAPCWCLLLISCLPAQCPMQIVRTSHSAMCIGCSENYSRQLNTLGNASPGICVSSHSIPTFRHSFSVWFQAAISLIFISACFVWTTKAFTSPHCLAAFTIPKDKNPAKSYVPPPLEIN